MSHRVKKEVWHYQSHNTHTGEYKEGYYSKRGTRGVKWKFVKMNTMHLLPFETEKYNIYFIKLFDYLEYRTNRLVQKKVVKRLRKPLTKTDMRKLFDVERTTVYRFLKEADELNIIKYVKEDKSFYVNPDIAVRGNEVVEGIFELFKEKNENR